MSQQTLTAAKGQFAPAFTLIVMAPLLTEVLPGATRFSSLFVFPVEMCVWGIAALLIRETLRRYNLGWPSMILMGLALAVAEECLIQQTSLAPMVLRIKGQTYARAYGVNYVYFLWALVYEPAFTVMLAISVVEMIYPSRKQMQWIRPAALFLLLPLLLLGSLLAWFSWTQIARVKVFHQPSYHAPVAAILLSIAAIVALVLAAFRIKQPVSKPLTPLSPSLLGFFGGLWAILLYGVVLLGFGADPDFPEWIAVTGTIVLLVIIPLATLPRMAAHPVWNTKHQFSLTCGTIIGSMAAGQLGFIGTTGPDLYFKVITNLIALVLLILLGMRIDKRQKLSNG
ncbi:MAG TPA: hypothetical protein VNU70_10950 [Puia sp.]|jgi:hypothetical protein|nr:hypothetical protein [Puia sp.]